MTTKTPIEPGLIARLVAGVRYGLTGQKPDWFGAGEPLQPVAQDQAVGRQFDYPVKTNLTLRPRANEAISFADMRGLSEGYDLLRLIIETRKDQITAIDWEISVKDSGNVNLKARKIKEFFQNPDKEHGFETWLRMIVEDLLVIDAPAIYPRLDYGGNLYALEPIDGSTIKRVIDDTGRTPVAPDPAYQQILKGLPAVDYTRDELIYKPRNLRTHKIYGYSPVEQIITTVNIAIRRQVHQLQFYTEGNVPEALASVPAEWQPEQIRQFQDYWDSLLSGDTANRRHLKFIPDGVKYIPTKEGVLKDEFDEWLARVVCFAFGVEPTPFIKQVNRSTSETSREQALAEGLAPIKQWVKNLIDGIITKYFNAPEIEFRWLDEPAVDPLIKAQIDQIYITSGVYEINEVRAKLGLKPIDTNETETEKDKTDNENLRGD